MVKCIDLSREIISIPPCYHHSCYCCCHVCKRQTKEKVSPIAAQCCFPSILNSEIAFMDVGWCSERRKVDCNIHNLTSHFLSNSSCSRHTIFKMHLVSFASLLPFIYFFYCLPVCLFQFNIINTRVWL